MISLPLLLGLHVGLALAAAPPFRKSLSFGPVLPHATWELNPATAFIAAAENDDDPFDVARTFLRKLAVETDRAGFVIRDDSYTDKNTGVTHIYVRQVVNGLEVVDGNININVKNGRVLSYGNSFYTGPIHPAGFESVSRLASQHTHSGYCDLLSSHIESHSTIASDDDEFEISYDTQAQVPLGAQPHGHSHSFEGHTGLTPSIHDIHSSNCAPSRFSHTTSPKEDPLFSDASFAALSFMVHATPDEGLAASISEEFGKWLDRIRSVPTNHFGVQGQAGSQGVRTAGVAEELHGVPDTVAPVKAQLVYVQTPSEEGTALNLVWKLEVQMENNWYDAAVSVTSPGTILSVTDWASDSPYFPAPKVAPIPHAKPHSYKVFPWGVNDPSVGERIVVQEHPDKLASPLGWHSLPAELDPRSRDLVGRKFKKGEVVNWTDTWGNNVFAHENWAGRSNWIDNNRPESSTEWPELTFDFKYHPKRKESDALEEAHKYINATVVQLFYTSNMIHDLYYRYGFDELSGNFQQYNFERGGEEDDGVITNAQDGSGFNNANFMTPPDGQNGRCRMYLWNTANPYRDGDLEAGIVIHELSHGASTRLTGGPKDSSCLGWGEAGGMGEGWGDFLATTIRSNKTYGDYAMGAWAANQTKGIRNYIYSLDHTVNPSTYKFLDKPGYWGVHAIGEVWAEILWTVLQNLIAKHGYSDTLFPPQPRDDGTLPEGNFYRTREIVKTRSDGSQVKEKLLVPIHGNSLAFQLVINGMKLQPCRPGFFEARDAIIQADEILTGGENFCEIWAGFSDRGLGPKAKVEGRTPWGGGVRTDDFKTPLTCQTKTPEPEEPEDFRLWKA